MSLELQESWDKTRSHLETARKRLAAKLEHSTRSDPLCQYEEWLEHNELELAMTELVAIGRECAITDEEFWTALTLAARNMGFSNYDKLPHV